ncbi:MAG: hypothetical protein DYG98_01710 [Haliscomenobacteraceae bacterium CHB4]|nr:hypothetical protein [Saprospiraceae bacterium]MCE7921747.1 hypothetical protein [Haliscomenobacteraceae bacterium CHB4]
MALPAIGQEEEAAQMPVERPVANTFESVLMIDNQTVMVPIKNTLEFDIQHRFGTMQNGFEDLFGLYAPSNIRLGFLFVPINNLAVGFGFSKKNTLLDFSAKYALLKQYKDWRRPVSVTYYGNAALDPRSADDREVYHESDRLAFFHQLIIARKINNWLSVQVAPSLSHYNLQPNRSMENDHFAIAFGAQVKVTEGMAIIANVDQPITQHDNNNPNPNVSLGIQMTTSAHAFQIFVGNYDGLVPQENNMFYRWIDNGNTEWNGFDRFVDRFRIGFNITRLWNF